MINFIVNAVSLCCTNYEQRFMSTFQGGYILKDVRKVLLSMFLVLALMLPAVSYADSPAENELDIQQYAASMQPGWNLGNTFDAVGTDETAWGNPFVTQAFIEQLADQGYKSIRIPVTFDQRMQTSGDYEINEAFLGRLDQTIDWALDEGLYVMINVHHDSWIWLESGMGQNHDTTLARYEAIWTQLADRYKDYPLELMFESINEPRFAGSDAEKQGYLNELNSSFHSIVRSSGGNNDIRPLVLPTLDTGSEQVKIDALYNFIDGLDDPNIIATIHYYGFWPFSVNIAGFTTFNEETKQDIVSTFDRVHSKFVENDIPVVIGEFGLLGFDTDLNTIQQGEKLKFFEFMIHYAQEKQLTHMLWDNGQHFGRQSYQWSDPELFAMMQASWASRSATATTDSVFIKRGQTITDVKIPLQLNGTQLTAIKHGEETLVAGQDYVLNEQELTLKASLLNQLVNANQLGTNAVLSASFNQGKAWKLFVISYDKPVPQSTTGTTSQFSIPLSFNGDKLATMEANYTDGSNAGPQNWTSFKEFAYTFKPDYTNNTLTLTANFFNEVNDGEVKLKLHFWSGELLEYKITKNGSEVTGTAINTGTDNGNGNGNSDGGSSNNNNEANNNGGNNEGNSNPDSNGSSENESGSNNEQNNKVVSYSDIASHWGYIGIFRATELSIVNGYADGSFRPDQAVTRAELAAIVGRALKLSADASAAGNTSFTDNENIPAYAKPYIKQLHEMQLINGYSDGSIRPAQSITRAELAVIIARALKLTDTAEPSYTDADSIPVWAQHEAAALAQMGIMTGKANGKFDPNHTATRAEAVTIIIRAIDYLESQPKQ